MWSLLHKSSIFFALVGGVLITALSSCFPFPGSSDGTQPRTLTTRTPVSNVIQQENALPGTSDWKISPAKEASIEIQAYASATSVSPGQTLTFFVSTQNENTAFSIDIYRLGWYQGLGGRIMLSVKNQTGFAQGYYDQFHHRLVDCSSCLIDQQTGLVEANWLPSYTLTVPFTWVTGVYLAKFTDVKGLQTYAPFDVKGNTHSLYVAVTSDTTYAAYNYWGEYSLYDAFDTLESANLHHGVKVSFDRPYEQGHGSGHVLIFEADAIHWLERQGYDLSYISNVDQHEDPAQLLQHRVYLSLGHDEYWTKEMRDGLEHARDNGVSLAFLGANDAYWQMRFEPDSRGISDRTIVCYKVLTGHGDLARDPLYGKDNTRVTTQWRDPLLSRPENALIGIMYSELTQRQQGFPWKVDPSAKSPFLDGTNLQPEQSYGCGLVGYEWDRVFANGATPKGLQVLGTSPTLDENNHPDISNTTYYIASSGTMVFATGSIYWAASLDTYRYEIDPLCVHEIAVVPAMQKLMVRIMDELLKHSRT